MSSPLRDPVKWLYHELGLESVYQTGPDTWLIILGRTFRLFAFGAVSLIIALFMSTLGFSDLQIGLFMTLTLSGDVILSLLTALIADRVGRRRILLLGGFLMVLSGAFFAYFESYWILLLAAVFGVISATGGDFGPFRSVEESTLSHLTTSSTRSDVLSWYVTTSTLGSAIGTEVAGRAVDFFQRSGGQSLLGAYHLMFWLYVAMGALSIASTLLMSRKCEISWPSQKDPKMNEPLLGSGHEEEQPCEGDGSSRSPLLQNEQVAAEDAALQGSPRNETARNPRFPLLRAWAAGLSATVSPESRPAVMKLWILLTIDSLADGMVSYALTNYYLARKFDLSESFRGDIMSISYLLMSVSTVLAGPLARHLGLINTMVFTHIPSSAAVLLFPIPQSLTLTMILLFVRTGLNNMDQGPRAAFIAAVVRPKERTAVMGITGMLRTLASTIGPSLTGFLAGTDRFWIAFVVAGVLRLGYDFGLFFLFVGMKLHSHEERENPEEDEPLDAPIDTRDEGAVRQRRVSIIERAEQ
ncbi:hypothetical protein HIM_06597 [Hirsutella minnesotensis 3608]|uniref:Major facilitator superfamily (MFS) profile domain-containing protein n=1 Tax=Hirsutella minnesotensis 3608 TaxID=1043627 RepID=A0A0F8A4P3_9HYPO|nr:hypothetical protein HIM_06597 [Hirsutella minnesotensis 3608]